MQTPETIIFYTLCAGACIPLGGALASIEKIRPQWLEQEFRHAVIAFGGGVLIAAVALLLVPEGTRLVNHTGFNVLFLLSGGLCFFVVERALGVRRRARPQFTAMLLDFIPESLALGSAFAAGSESAITLSVFIGLQNLPEGFNAFRELRSVPGTGAARIIGSMVLLVPLGPLVAGAGILWFGDNPLLPGAIMLFASGGILYLIFQDIAPQSRMRRHWAPPLGAVLGFCVGLLGNSLVPCG